ncbi:MAG: metallophosphoesterase [Lachnospiraceae bacterium]
MKRDIVKRNILITLALGISLVLVVGFNQALDVKYYTVHEEKMMDPLRIILLTDFHSCAFGEQEEELVDRIRQQDPDIILFGGDIIDDDEPIDNSYDLLEKIGDEYPCFYVSGNHEVWTGQLEAVKSIVRGYGVIVLDGEYDIVTIRGQEFAICGVDDPAIGTAAYHTQIKECAKQMRKHLFTIFLTHRPERVDTYLDAGFDFILAGHAHGGQWRFPPFCNGVYAPTQKWFPKYVGGEYKIGSSKMIVGRGLARETNNLPRFFNRPEVVVIDVVPD